jgi:hypothetical protein
VSSVSKDALEQQLARLYTTEVSDEEFFVEFGTSQEDVVAFGLRMLTDAVRERDPLLEELGTYVGYRFGFSAAHVPVLHELAEASWHNDHADIVRALAKLRAPESVDVLYRVALSRHEQLDEDDEFELGRKCLYALGDIGDAHALQRIDQLASGADERLATAAVRQLARVYTKTQAEDVREQAARLLDRKRRLAGVFDAAYRHFDAQLLDLAFTLAGHWGIDEACVEPLAQILGSSFTARRADVIAALEGIDSDAARSALQRA